MRTPSLIIVLTITTTLLPLPTHSSLGIIRSSVGGIGKDNPCANELIGGYTSKISQSSTSSGYESESLVRHICPRLKFTCCNSNVLKDFGEQLKKSMAFLEMRMEKMNMLFDTILKMAPETYKVFLKGLTEVEHTCYNTIKELRVSERESKFASKPDLIKRMKDRLPSLMFNVEKMTNSFAKLRELSKNFISDYKEIHEKKAEYYSGFVCSMCSPEITKYYSSNPSEDGSKRIPKMVFNTFFCKDIITLSVKQIEINEIFKYVQSILDISWCARTNSMKETKDYPGIDSVSLQMLPMPFEYFQSVIESKQRCTYNIEFFHYDKPEAGHKTCLQMCHEEAKLFNFSAVKLKKILIAENEVYNTFLREDGEIASEDRLKKALDKYDRKRRVFIENGAVRLPNGSDAIEGIHMLQEQNDNVLSMRELEIEVNDSRGIYSYHSPMNPDYFIFVGRWGVVLCSVLWLLIL